MPTSGAVQAAATGMSPEKSVARSAPMRCMPMYQHTKPTTVTTAACHNSAATSVASGIRSHAPPVRRAVRIPATADSTAAIPQTVADSSRGPSGRSTGTASTAKPTSPASAHTEYAIPVPSVRPQPWTVKAPTATSDAPYRTGRWGRRPQEGDDNGHDHRGAAHEHARNGWFRGAFGGDHGEVEADHADGREQREAPHRRTVSRRSGAVPPRPTSGRSSTQARP